MIGLLALVRWFLEEVGCLLTELEELGEYELTAVRQEVIIEISLFMPETSLGVSFARFLMSKGCALELERLVLSCLSCLTSRRIDCLGRYE